MFEIDSTDVSLISSVQIIDAAEVQCGEIQCSGGSKF